LTADNLPKHNHKFTTGPDGAHDHYFIDHFWKKSLVDPGGLIPVQICSQYTTTVKRTTEKAGKHSHSGNTNTKGSSKPFDNRPKYYRLAFITKKYQAPQTNRFRPQFYAPNGSVVMWSGDPQTLPNGWRLCNGSNGAPDLRYRFILGVKQDQDPGETGGADTIDLYPSHLPSHKHGFNTSTFGDHVHDYDDHWLDVYNKSMVGFWFQDLVWPGDTMKIRNTEPSNAGLQEGTTPLTTDLPFTVWPSSY